MEIDCYVLKARRQDMDRLCVWIKSDKIGWKTDIVRIATAGGKTVYAQCRKVDHNYAEEFRKHEAQYAIIKGKADVVVMSQYYREKLGIEDSTQKTTPLRITQANVIEDLWWAACCHPERFAHISFRLAIVGVLIGLVSLWISLPSCSR